jgi:hypothetical protein
MPKIGAHIVNVLVATAVIFATAPARAAQEDTSGNQLYELCSAPDPTWQSALCDGYVLAIDDMLTAQHMLDAQKGICLPDGVTREQMKVVVTSYLRDHLDERQKWMFVLASEALVAAFPCKKP